MKLNMVLIINSLLLIGFLILSVLYDNELYMITSYLFTGLLFIIGVIGCIDYRPMGYISLAISIISCGLLTYLQFI